jgi:monoamine oxidase
LNVDADAIVIGAGAAGLAAAQMLASHSLRVIAIEARDRIGGRAWSTVCAATSVELGAEFIHGPAVETRAMLASFGASSIPLDGESWSGKGGTLVRADRDFAGAGEIFAALDAVSGDESVSRFLRRFANDDAKRKLAVWVREFVEGFDAADPAVASVRGIATEWASGTCKKQWKTPACKRTLPASSGEFAGGPARSRST